MTLRKSARQAEDVWRLQLLIDSVVDYAMLRLLRATSLLQTWLLRARLRLVDHEIKTPPGLKPSGWTVRLRVVSLGTSDGNPTSGRYPSKQLRSVDEPGLLCFYDSL